MDLTLTTTEQARLAGAARALLSPLDEDSVDRWRRDVLVRLAELLEADGAGFILPVRGAAPYTLHAMPDEFARAFFESGADDDMALQAMRREGGGVWCTRLLGERLGVRMPDEWLATEDYRSLYGPYGIRDAIGFMTFPDLEIVPPPHVSGGNPVAGVLTCFRDVYGTELFGDRGVAMLKLLLPALEAGVATHVRLAVRARALEKAFDAAGYGIAVYGLDSRRLYANRAFTRLVDQDPQRERLLRAVEAGVGAISGFVHAEAGAIRPEELGEASREIRTARARYRLRLNLIGEGLFTSQPSVLTALEPITPQRPSVQELQRRWGLTPQEARVALLLADGRTNRQIAEAMGLRPATTRHYTEAVFLKLGVHTRAEAAAKVLTG